MKNTVILCVLIIILTGAIMYICRAKRAGKKCVSCPYAKMCTGGNSPCCKIENDKDNQI